MVAAAVVVVVVVISRLPRHGVFHPFVLITGVPFEIERGD